MFFDMELYIKTMCIYKRWATASILLISSFLNYIMIKLDNYAVQLCQL